MPQPPTIDFYRVMTGDGFRLTLEDLAWRMNSLSADEAASQVGRLNRATRRAASQMSPDDAEETLILAETMIDSVRRSWKRQRRNSLIEAAVASLLAGAAATIMRAGLTRAGLPTGLFVALIILGVIAAFMSARSAAEASDWKDEVVKPLESIAATLTEVVQIDRKTPSPYRATGSTGARIAPTMGPEEHPDVDAPHATDSELRGSRGRQ